MKKKFKKSRNTVLACAIFKTHTIDDSRIYFIVDAPAMIRNLREEILPGDPDRTGCAIVATVVYNNYNVHNLRTGTAIDRP